MACSVADPDLALDFQISGSGSNPFYLSIFGRIKRTSSIQSKRRIYQLQYHSIVLQYTQSRIQRLIIINNIFLYLFFHFCWIRNNNPDPGKSSDPCESGSATLAALQKKKKKSNAASSVADPDPNLISSIRISILPLDVQKIVLKKFKRMSNFSAWRLFLVDHRFERKVIIFTSKFMGLNRNRIWVNKIFDPNYVFNSGPQHNFWGEKKFFLVSSLMCSYKQNFIWKFNYQDFRHKFLLFYF